MKNAEILKGFLILFLIALQSCGQRAEADEEALETFQRQLDIETEKRIDAAYVLMQKRCDSLIQYQVPLIADSIIRSEAGKP